MANKINELEMTVKIKDERINSLVAQLNEANINA